MAPLHAFSIIHRHFRGDLARWQHLVTPSWLSELQHGRPVRAAPVRQWRVFEAGFGAVAQFAQGHVPGAVYLDTRCMERPPLWNRLPDAALLELLRQLDVQTDTTVILYGRSNAAAARVAHLMLYAGVRDVRLLDGGLAAWTRADLPLEAESTCGESRRTAPRAPIHPSDFATSIAPCPQILVDTRQLKALLAGADTRIVSIRTRDEFMGRTSGYSYIPARGEIPGAVWGHAGDSGDINSMSAFHNPDGTMKPAAEITRFWHEAGIRANQPTVFYCGTGWRASLAFFYAWLMGWEDIAVYDGGWLEWSRDPDNPRTVRSASGPAHAEGQAA